MSKYKLMALAIITSLAIIGCRKTILGIHFGEKFEMHPGQSAIVKNKQEMAHLYFLSVIEDNRCPGSMPCDKKGNVKLLMQLGLDTFHVSHNKKEINGYELEVGGFSTAPVEPAEIMETEYSATFVLSKKK